MYEKHTTILGIRILNMPVEGLLAEIEELLRKPAGTLPIQIVTINPLIFDSALRLREMFEIISKSGMVIADSIGIKLMGFMYLKNIFRVRGIDLMDRILNTAEEKNHGVFFFGASEENIKYAAENLKKEYPELNIKGFRSGYFDKSLDGAVVQEINNSGSDIVFVGLSTPMQELWIGRNLDKIKCRIVMGVGGSFDVLSGRLISAPGWMRACGIEWLFRALQEPVRFRRILNIPIFLLKAFLMRLHFLKHPFI